MTTNEIISLLLSVLLPCIGAVAGYAANKAKTDVHIKSICRRLDSLEAVKTEVEIAKLNGKIDTLISMVEHIKEAHGK